MVITENYQSTPHTDRDLSNYVISWFLEGECSLSLLFVLDIIGFVDYQLHKNILKFNDFEQHIHNIYK
jgi:hypothetical protein